MPYSSFFCQNKGDYFCRRCSNAVEHNYHPFGLDYCQEQGVTYWPEYYKKLQNATKCYVCFSKSHVRANCQDRFKAPNMFPPNIDTNLLPRFMEMLIFEEKYSMIFSFPKAFNSISIKPIKVMHQKYVKYEHAKNFSKADLFLVDEVDIQSWFDIGGNGGIGMSKSMNVRIESLELDTLYKEFPTEEFLLLLSPKLKAIKCRNVKFLPKLSFCNIIKNAPDLEEIDIAKTDIECDYSWPELKFTRAEHIKIISLSMNEQDFRVSRLAALMQRKKANIHIYLPATQTQLLDKKKTLKTITDKLSIYFSPTESTSSPSLTISFNLGNGWLDSDLQNYELKNLYILL